MGEGPPGKVRIGSKKQKRCGGFTPTPLTSFFVRKAKLSFRNFLAKKLSNQLQNRCFPIRLITGRVRIQALLVLSGL